MDLFEDSNGLMRFQRLHRHLSRPRPGLLQEVLEERPFFDLLRNTRAMSSHPMSLAAMEASYNALSAGRRSV